jgi:ABC-type transport system involved in multi-copper enzyme maturation permease subunit
MHRSVFISSIVVAVALAIWLAITGAMEANSWAIFTSHHCSPDYPGSSLVCMNSLSGVGNFSTVNAALCGALPALLGMVLGVPLVASEIQQRTNRLAWTQSITRTHWLLVKIGVGTLFTAVIVGALAPLVWWWTDAAQRSHIQPANFDVDPDCRRARTSSQA